MSLNEMTLLAAVSSLAIHPPNCQFKNIQLNIEKLNGGKTSKIIVYN
jgi:hypothetical protein